MQVCQEHWHRGAGTHTGHLLTTINGYLSLSSQKDAETDMWVQIIYLRSDS